VLEVIIDHILSHAPVTPRHHAGRSWDATLVQFLGSTFHELR
jgi:hypothetical protein